jgi:hypothetical protein
MTTEDTDQHIIIARGVAARLAFVRDYSGGKADIAGLPSRATSGLMRRSK